MDSNCTKYKCYVNLLKKELVPAMGCTEPISLAYAASKCQSVLNETPVKVEVKVSANIIKNVKSVIVPNTGGLKGISAAVSAGIVAGNADKKLEVLSSVTDIDKINIKKYLENTSISVEKLDEGHIFDILVKEYSNNHSAEVRIVDSHTNIVSIKYDEKDIEFERSDVSCVKKEDKDDSFIKEVTIDDIFDFAETCNLEDVKEILDRQINYNMAIAEDGLKNPYGANVGKVLLETYGDSTSVKARAYAASASDARMNGCEKPVVINSGSGNQGITASVPVIVYARDLNKTDEELYRALLISNLVTLHIKSDIGRLSAYCGAVAAGCGSGAGICYLLTKNKKAINHTIVNSIAITSGIVCDGAKSSCAAKIASSVDAGILGYNMYKLGNQFRSGDGIVKKGVENTIHSVGILASKGMCETDKEIIKIMLDE